MQDPPSLKRLLVLTKKIRPTSLLTPENVREEKLKFFSSSTYNPRFVYPRFRDSLKELRKKIEGAESVGLSFWEKIFQKTKRLALLQLSLIQKIGTEDFPYLSFEIYKRLSPKLIRQARKEIEAKPFLVPERPIYSASQARSIFKKKLRFYNLDGFQVKISKRISADCVIRYKKILIRSSVYFSRPRIRKTIAHEIETHLLRSFNGSRQPYRIFKQGFPGYFKTEEGLAVYNESLASSRISEKNFWPAAYVVAIDTALSGSFRDVFNQMLQFGFSVERAWTISLKVKRGISKTSHPGAFAKDTIYLAGRNLIENYIKRGGGLKRLYIGKIGIGDLSLLKNLPDLKKKKIYPRFYKK